MARSTKLDDDLQKKFCDAVAAGNYYQAACGYAGISHETFRQWMKRGKHSSRGRFRKFYLAVKKAEADAEVRMVAQWQKAMPENWQACRDFLARRHPGRWAEKGRLEMSTPPGKPLAVQLRMIGLDPARIPDMTMEEVDGFLAKLLEIAGGPRSGNGAAAPQELPGPGAGPAGEPGHGTEPGGNGTG